MAKILDGGYVDDGKRWKAIITCGKCGTKFESGERDIVLIMDSNSSNSHTAFVECPTCTKMIASKVPYAVVHRHNNKSVGGFVSDIVKEVKSILGFDV